jgi:hypothetical protein
MTDPTPIQIAVGLAVYCGSLLAFGCVGMALFVWAFLKLIPALVRVLEWSEGK